MPRSQDEARQCARIGAAMTELRVPDGLKERDQWLLWRKEVVRDRQAKVPYTVQGFRASVTDVRHVATFEEAMEAWNRARGRYAGLGFVFVAGGGLVGIDLDDCLKDGSVKQWAAGVVERFSDCYCEVSPSGAGLKIFCRGDLPANLPGVKVADGSIEMYSSARYFTVTGQAYRGAPPALEEHTADVVHMYERLTQSSKVKSWPLQPLAGGKIPYGMQHNTLVSVAGTLRARRVCDEAILAALLAINAHQCERPASAEHVAAIVRSTRQWGVR
jgi:putative DNA primase/helicase